MAAAFVQGKGNNGTSVSVRTIVLGSSVAIGDILWVCGAWVEGGGGAATRTAAVTDSAGNTYVQNTQRTKTGTGSNNSRINSFYCINGTAAAHTITVTLTGGSVGFMAVNAIELSGVDVSDPLVQENWGQGIVSTVNAGSLVTDADDAILVSMIMLSNARTFISPDGYTRSTATTTEDGSLAHCVYRAVGAADTYPCVHSWTGGDSNGIAVHDGFRATIIPAPTTRVLNKLRTRALNRGIN
jgi:hypothetical protein